MAREQGLNHRAARERDLHLSQIRAYGFFPGRGPKRGATSVPVPLRYWQYDLPRPVPVVFVVVVVGIWLALFGWGGSRQALLDEAPLALGVGLIFLLLNCGRFTVSDHGMSPDIGATMALSSTLLVTSSLNTAAVPPLAAIRSTVSCADAGL